MCESVWVGFFFFFFNFFYASLCLCLMVTGEKADGTLRESDDIAGALQLPALVRGYWIHILDKQEIKLHEKVLEQVTEKLI